MIFIIDFVVEPGRQTGQGGIAGVGGAGEGAGFDGEREEK